MSHRSRGARIAITFACSIVVLCGSSLALSADDDTVHLKNGGRLRGTVMAEEPGGMSIKLVDGSVRTVRSADVDKVEYGSAATADRGAAPAGDDAPGRGPVVTLASDDQAATLDRILTSVQYNGRSFSGKSMSVSGAEWSTVCTVPCGKRLERNATYQVRGTQGGWSKEFTLPPGDALTLTVKSGNHRGVPWAVIGIVSTLVGGGLVLGGVASDNNVALTMGLLAAGVGVPMTIVGFAINSDTMVTSEGRQIARNTPRLIGVGLSGRF